MRFRWLMGLMLALLLRWQIASAAAVTNPAVSLSPAGALFSRTNLAAWCIVPFDAKKRSPEERAAMLERLGISMLAYDYRAEHIPTFDREMEALERHHIRLLAWWFPGALNDEARLILDVLKRHRLRGVQLWVTGNGQPVAGAAAQAARIEAEAARLRPIAEAAAAVNSPVGLYNHGGWFGQPENQLAIIQRLQAQGVTNLGIVYNLHHGHEHLDRFAALLQLMKPHLLALNLNGMVPQGDQQGKKILPLGQGTLDLDLLRIIRASGWSGPIGLLNHTDEDAETRLRDNLIGLESLLKQIASTGTNGATPSKYWAIEDAQAREQLPLYQLIPAATLEELTPANGCPKPETFLSWHRSHRDNAGTRYSALGQINRSNIARLRQAWIYQARDASNNIQCNPIVVDGVMFAPTPGRHVVAVDATNGRELWRFRPAGRPGFRGQ
jgi:hypothetical protein